MTLKRHACLAIFLLLPACSPLESQMENIADKATSFMNALVPEQHRKFARNYFDQLLAGETESTQVMNRELTGEMAKAIARTDRFCFSDLRRLQNPDDAPASSQACSESDTVLRQARYFIDGRTPDKVTVGDYHWNKTADGAVSINISLEYHFGEDIVRTSMNYHRDGARRWIEKAEVTLDSMTLRDRTWQELDDEMLLPIGVLLAVQLIVYLATPVIVLLILRRQRCQRAEMLAGSRRSGSDHFEA